jgi:CRP-like cAMP-binding protein
LINGTLDVSVHHRDKDIRLQPLKEDDFFGELALLAAFDWFFSVRAVTDVEVLIIHRRSFQKILEKFPSHKDMLIERVIQLRVDRLVRQTSFMLDKFLSADDPPVISLI